MNEGLGRKQLALLSGAVASLQNNCTKPLFGQEHYLPPVVSITFFLGNSVMVHVLLSFEVNFRPYSLV